MLDSQTLLAHAHSVQRLEAELQALGFCFDTYLEFTRDGRAPDGTMDAASATRQLEAAVRRVLLLPEDNQ